jgi:hypothetical protein
MEMGMGDVEEQADDVYNGILGEIGLEYNEMDPVSIRHFLISGVGKNEGEDCTKVGRTNGRKQRG